VKRDIFLPRDGRLRLGGIPWLARMIDKGRARNADTIGDYEFPCSLDERLLAFLGLGADTFLELLKSCPGDEEVVAALGLDRRDPMVLVPWSDVFLIRHSRLLDAQEREEHQ
jgi:hypothetical protein